MIITWMVRGPLKTLRGWVAIGPSLFCVLVVAYATAAWAADSDIISAPQAWQRVEAGELIVIDIRTEDEWRETGIPAGAHRASLFYAYGLPNLSFISEVRETAGGNMSHPIALICAAGVRSSVGRVLLEAEGFDHVFDVGEGMLGSGDGPGWLARGLPVDDCGDCAAP